MALGDFLDILPPDKLALKNDLQSIDARLSALEAGLQSIDARLSAVEARPSSFHFVAGPPPANLGIDGNASVDTTTGYIWRKDAGAWVNTLFSLWKG